MSQGVVITGAARGIGRAIALASASRGWSVGIIDRERGLAEAVAEEARTAGAARAIAVPADVSEEDSISTAIEEASSAIGGAHGFVANAGIESSASIIDLDAEDWNRVLAVNLTGAFLTVRAAARVLARVGEPGSIVCVSSPSAFVGFAGGANAAYGSSKGGLSALVRAAAIDLAPKGIRVNAVVPGATDTAMLYFGLDGTELEKERERLRARAAEQIPLGRMGDPREIANAVTWLLGEDSSYVTGSHLVCDGGLMARSANDF